MAEEGGDADVQSAEQDADRGHPSTGVLPSSGGATSTATSRALLADTSRAMPSRRRPPMTSAVKLRTSRNIRLGTTEKPSSAMPRPQCTASTASRTRVTLRGSCWRKRWPRWYARCG